MREKKGSPIWDFLFSFECFVVYCEHCFLSATIFCEKCMLAPARNKKIKKLAFFLPVLTLFLVSGILYPQPVSAGFIWDLIFTTDPVGQAMKGLLYMVFEGVGILLSGAVAIFSYAVDTGTYGPDGLFNRQSVYAMWKFIRDFLNLFFILTLLYTAFTIVFQIAGNYKKTLLSIVLAALFVNFSFPISRVMIDISNVPMYYFIELTMGTKVDGTTAQSALGPALSASGLKDILIPSKLGLSSVSQIFMGIIFMFVFMVTIMVLAVMLTIRMMMLLVLVMFSSIGFAGSIIPGMKKYSDMWWDSFAKNALFGPAAMLMLFVASRLFSEIGKDDTNQKIANSMSPDAVQGAASLFGSMGMYAITIIMLWIAIGLANSMSIVGASAVTGKGQQFLKWAGRKSTVSPAMWAGRKVDSKLAGTKYGQYLSPGAWRMAFKQRGEEQKHNDEQPIKLAAATRQDQLNDVVSRATRAGSTVIEGGITALPGALKTAWKTHGGDHTDHRFAERQSQKAGHAKEITEVSDRSDIVIQHLEAAIAQKDAAKAEAAISVLAKNNDLNDLIVGHGHKYGGTNEVSSDNLKVILDNILNASGMDNKEDIAKTLTVLSDQSLVSGNYAFGGMSTYDASTGAFSISTAAQQAGQVAAKFDNLEPQKQATLLHPDTLFKRDASGFTDMNDDVAVAIIGKITKGTADQSNRSRSDMRAALQNAYEQVTLHGSTSFPKFQANYNANANFRYYVGKMLEQNGALPSSVDPKNIAGTMPTSI